MSGNKFLILYADEKYEGSIYVNILNWLSIIYIERIYHSILLHSMEEMSSSKKKSVLFFFSIFHKTCFNKTWFSGMRRVHLSKCENWLHLLFSSSSKICRFETQNVICFSLFNEDVRSLYRWNWHIYDVSVNPLVNIFLSQCNVRTELFITTLYTSVRDKCGETNVGCKTWHKARFISRSYHQCRAQVSRINVK